MHIKIHTDDPQSCIYIPPRRTECDYWLLLLLFVGYNRSQSCIQLKSRACMYIQSLYDIDRSHIHTPNVSLFCLVGNIDPQKKKASIAPAVTKGTIFKDHYTEPDKYFEGQCIINIKTLYSMSKKYYVFIFSRFKSYITSQPKNICRHIVQFLISLAIIFWQ